MSTHRMSVTRRRLPNRRPSETFELESQSLHFTATVSRAVDARLRKSF